MKRSLSLTSVLFLLFCAMGILLHTATAQAQERLSLSVTPPLFQISIVPGEEWRSSVKVVNNNQFDITVWAEPVIFEARGEGGHGRFEPVLGREIDESVIASWIDIPPGPHTISGEQSLDIPFTLDVPDDAPPGGHSAAILVGTRPPVDEDTPYVVSTSQVVTSLLFARIQGDVVEKGSIREFSVSKLFHDRPEVDFVLRFQNEGNVHLRPQGNITIYNMWGKEVGYIPVNQGSVYGNVLPESIRKYEFSWNGEPSLTDIGRHKAVATVGYGEDARHSYDATTYFWVIPVKATLITLGSVIGFVLFIIWAIRRYIRRAMLMAGIDPSDAREVTTTKKKQVSERSASIRAPFESGVLDLRKHMEDRDGGNKFTALWTFIRHYRTFSISLVVFILMISAAVYYIVDARTNERSYEVTVKNPDEEVVISSEEIIKERIEAEQVTEKGSPNEKNENVIAQEFELFVVNASGDTGAAAQVAIELEELEYRVDDISTDVGRTQRRSAIVYTDGLEEVALKLSGQLGNVPISIDGTASSTATTTPTIKLIVGGDLSGT